MICFFGFAYDVGGETGVSALSAGVGLSGPIAQGLGLLSDSGKRFGSADFFLSMLALQAPPTCCLARVVDSCPLNTQWLSVHRDVAMWA